MPLVDSHCHFNHPRLRNDLPGLLARANQAGVQSMVVVGYDLESSAEAAALAQAHSSLVAAVGVHPHDADTYSPTAAAELATLCGMPRVVAYGEIGLDYHYDNSPRPAQRDAFERQLSEAHGLGLPVVIHSRDAAADTRAILENHAPLPAGGVMHCYAYGPEDLDWVLGLDLYVGLTGVVTFPKAVPAREVACRVPLERLLIETDAPYLAPAPHRGRSNEPAYLPAIAEAVARARGVSPGEIEDATARNAAKLFGELMCR